MFWNNWQGRTRALGEAFKLLAFVSAISLFASCAQGTSGPVATVTLGLDRTSVPLGGPITLSFQFVVSPDIESMPQDYRVMVHFLDSDGELMWANDHDPPTPTEQWQPGQTISYTRRGQVPM